LTRGDGKKAGAIGRPSRRGAGKGQTSPGGEWSEESKVMEVVRKKKTNRQEPTRERGGGGGKAKDWDGRGVKGEMIFPVKMGPGEPSC